MEILQTLNPGWTLLVLSCLALVGTAAVARHRVSVLEKRMDATRAEQMDHLERLVRIETKLDVALKNGGNHE